MTDTLPKTSYIFIDRRETGHGKSLGNRQRLLRRIKDAIRQSKPKDIDVGGVKGMGASGASTANAVKVTKHTLSEPTFHYASHTGEHNKVLIGNDEWERGDDFPINTDGESIMAAGNGEDSEDDFIVNVSRDEYLNVFFEGCELPDLQETQAKELPELMPKHAGFQKEGNPAQLNVARSYKNALPRRRALTKEAREERDALLRELEELEAQIKVTPDVTLLAAEVEIIRTQLKYLETKITGVPFFEKLDLRYTKKEKVLVKSADAVFAMIMDVSGSMDEEKKRLARKFFSLQYAFIKRKYPQTDLIFIPHTDKAQEMTEEEFFTTRLSGGTTVSPAYILLHQILKERYDAASTNIYLSQASDGDNWDVDNQHIIPELEGSGLLAKLRHMSYAQVGQSYAGFSNATLWSTLETIASATKKLSMVKITRDDEVFSAFQRIYARRTATAK